MSEPNYNDMIENAVRWAKAQLDQNNYPFRCLAFVEDAYERGNQIEIFGGSSAKELAEMYGAEQNSGEIPLGAFVFYDCSGPINGVNQNWGHVGLHIGDGNIIHSYGCVRIDHYLVVPELPAAPGWTKAQYIGWAPVQRIFEGWRKKEYSKE